MSQCFHHPETEAVGFCRQCGKALCTECRHDVRGVLYCEECLAATLAGPAAGSAPSTGGPNPALAAILACIPGVGAIYNGEYMKALMFILIFGGTISVMDSGAARGFEPLLSLFMFGFYAFMIVDSYKSAKARAGSPAPATTTGTWEFPGMGDGKATPVGPLILIVVGAVFLVNSLDIFSFGFHIFRFWPMILIAIGAYMIWQRMEGRPPSKPGDNQPGGSQ
jgi:hypothetical protein